MQQLKRFVWSCSVMDNRHQCSDDRRGIGMLDHISSINNPRRSLLHEFMSTPQDFFFRRLPAATNQYWFTRCHFDDSVIVINIRGWIGFDNIGAQLDGLPNQGDNLLWIPVDSIAFPGACLHYQW